MDKQSFVSSLKEKAGVDNISERSYDEVATLFAPQFADDSKVTDELWSFPVQLLKTMSGQLRHDTSAGINDFKSKYESEHQSALEKAKADAIASFKSEWEKSHPSEASGNQEPPKKDEADLAKLVASQVAEQMKALTGADSEFGKLSKQFNDYLKLQAAKDKAATEEQMRSEILDLVMSFDGLDEDDVIVENTMLKLHIDKDKDMAALKNEAKSVYEKVYKKFVEKHGSGQPLTGGAGDGGNNGGGAAEWLKGRDKQTQAQAEAAEARRKLLK